MADSPVFECVCDALQERTSLDRLEARGTVRIALKTAGLDAQSVNAEQMVAVLRKLMPTELSVRGIDDPGVCSDLAEEVSGMTFNVAPDRASLAAQTVGRFGA